MYIKEITQSYSHNVIAEIYVLQDVNPFRLVNSSRRFKGS